MAATFTYNGFGARPPFNPGMPAQLANGQALPANDSLVTGSYLYQGPGATMPAGSYGQRRGRPAWSQNNNSESTVQPAAVSQADLLAEEEAAAAVTPATPAPGRHHELAG